MPMVHKGKAYRFVIKLAVFAACIWMLVSSFLESPNRLQKRKPKLPWEDEENDVAAVQQQKLRTDRVRVDVYYEVLCPDSRYFFLKQLHPAWLKVGEIMDVRFKPYGKARHKQGLRQLEFECQHGPIECEGNMYHACAAKHVSDPAVLMELVRCMIDDSYVPAASGRRCAAQGNVDWTPIQRCVADEEGRELMREIGEETHAMRPKLTFVPTVLLNGNRDDQASMLKNFLAELCRKYQGTRPANCLPIL